MAQVDLPKISYFRCHVGHQFAPQALAAAQVEASETKLWSAVAALEEQATVLRYLRQPARVRTRLAEGDGTSTDATAMRKISPPGPLPCGARFGIGQAIHRTSDSSPD